MLPPGKGQEVKYFSIFILAVEYYKFTKEYFSSNVWNFFIIRACHRGMFI